MADIFSEVDWDSRLDPYNHAPHFPFSFTVITDTFPIFIEAPRDPFLNDLFYGGKYGRHCVKVGIGGAEVHFVSLCLGTSLFPPPFKYDSDLPEEDRILEWCPRWLGKRHYNCKRHDREQPASALGVVSFISAPRTCYSTPHTTEFEGGWATASICLFGVAWRGIGGSVSRTQDPRVITDSQRANGSAMVSLAFIDLASSRS
jgi:hypothetical protein